MRHIHIHIHTKLRLNFSKAFSPSIKCCQPNEILINFRLIHSDVITRPMPNKSHFYSRQKPSTSSGRLKSTIGLNPTRPQDLSNPSKNKTRHKINPPQLYERHTSLVLEWPWQERGWSVQPTKTISPLGRPSQQPSNHNQPKRTC